MNPSTILIIWIICGLISAAAWLTSVARCNGRVTVGNALEAVFLSLFGVGGMLAMIVLWTVEHVCLRSDRVLWRKKP